MKILIAEDESVSRQTLEHRLVGWGYVVTATADGAEAWQAFKADEFDIVICDWEMPELTGVELIHRIRSIADCPFVYIIMLTGRTETDNVVEGIGSGADDFLTKPIEKAELKVRLLAGERIVRLERGLTQRSNELRLAQDELQSLTDKLSKYLSPAIYQSLFEGKHDARIATRRKNPAVFFSDIADFTAISEDLDPEALSTLLNEYLLEMTNLVIEYGGHAAKADQGCGHLFWQCEGYNIIAELGVVPGMTA